MTRTHFSLFSGIGGLDLAAEMAGLVTVGQCEYADYPTKVLEKHWPDVPRWRDVRDVTADSFRERTGLSTVDVISGGPPCQPHSIAGPKKGATDSRDLWHEYYRIIGEMRPTWVVVENVVGFLYTIHGSVCADLENMDYSTSAFSVPAYAVGAPHERYRMFIVANSNGKSKLEAYTPADEKRTLQGAREHAVRWPWDLLPGSYWAIHKPPVCGMDDGLPGRMDKYIDQMSALGNAVVPQQAYPIFEAIKAVEI